MMKRNVILLFCLLLSATLCRAAAGGDDRYGWPEQKAPEKLIVCKNPANSAERMLLESLSGLAAKAVNEERFDRMVWMETGNEAYRRLFRESLEALDIREIFPMDTWELVDYLKKEGVVRGYVLYEADKGNGTKIENYSSNVATVYASLLSGVLIDVSLEQEALAHGLVKLKDARGETTIECFRKNRRLLNNTSALSIHPAVSNMRDYAIAHRLMLYADEIETANEILEWVKPLSPIVGWGCGDEFKFTKLVTEWGHFNTASNWCMNLPLISAAAPRIPLRKVTEVEPEQINFADSSYVHAFVMSDGDNMQWTMGNFIDNPHYLGHPQAADQGMNWTLCPANLSVISPVSWNEMVARKGNGTFIEYGGGYQYPDLFAVKRKNRKELLRRFARRVNSFLQKTGVKVYGAICENVQSPEAQEAFQIYAEEMTDITGMIAIQYFPYELGKKVFWFQNKKGMQIPLLTATFSLWNEVNPARPACGTPEYVSSLINRDEKLSVAEDRYSWTIVHAWSDFGQTSKVSGESAVGVSPIVATEELLDDGIRPVSLNELLWRVRMSYYPEQVKSIIDANQKLMGAADSIRSVRKGEKR